MVVIRLAYFVLGQTEQVCLGYLGVILERQFSYGGRVSEGLEDLEAGLEEKGRSVTDPQVRRGEGHECP